MNNIIDPPSNRKTIRLPYHDYASFAAYHVTVCTYEHGMLLSSIIDGRVALSDIGAIVEQEWLSTADVRREVTLDCFVIMPNHVHAILQIDPGSNMVGASKSVTDSRSIAHYPSKSLGALMGGWKSCVTSRVRRETSLAEGKLWQPRYYDTIIRDDIQLARTREYINTNPARWRQDT